MKNKFYVSALFLTLLASPVAKAGDVLDQPAIKGAIIGAAIGCGGAIGAAADVGKVMHISAKEYATACLAGGAIVGSVGALYGEGYELITDYYSQPTEQELAQDPEE